MAVRQEDELGPKRERLSSIEEMIVKAEQRIKRLVANLGDEEDEIISSKLKAEIKNTSRQREALQSEQKTIHAELSQLTLGIEMDDKLLEFACSIRGVLEHPTIETKRDLLAAAWIMVYCFPDNGSYRLGASCEIVPEQVIDLYPVLRFFQPRRGSQ
jgi:hypothetical protein